MKETEDMQRTDAGELSVAIVAEVPLPAWLDREPAVSGPACVTPFSGVEVDSSMVSSNSMCPVDADSVSTGRMGMGIYEAPLPYRPYRDDLVAGTLLLCFFILMFVLAGGRRFFIEQAKNFFFSRRSYSTMSSQETGREMRYTVFLVLQSCIMMGLFSFDILQEKIAVPTGLITQQALLGLCVGTYVSYYIVKLLLYALVNGTFFDKERQELWMRSYLLTVSLEGIFLFPLALLTIYLGLSSSGGMLYFVLLHSLVEISLFYKCFSLFFRDIYGGFHLIMYFCALELVPMSALWHTIVHLGYMYA